MFSSKHRLWFVVAFVAAELALSTRLRADEQNLLPALKELEGVSQKTCRRLLAVDFEVSRELVELSRGRLEQKQDGDPEVAAATALLMVDRMRALLEIGNKLDSDIQAPPWLLQNELNVNDLPTRCSQWLIAIDAAVPGAERTRRRELRVKRVALLLEQLTALETLARSDHTYSYSDLVPVLEKSLNATLELCDTYAERTARCQQYIQRIKDTLEAAKSARGDGYVSPTDLRCLEILLLDTQIRLLDEQQRDKEHKAKSKEDAEQKLKDLERDGQRRRWVDRPDHILRDRRMPRNP